MIKAHSLTRAYDQVVAVKDVTFDIGKNEIVALLGHNGAGKSTLIKMIIGCLEPTNGSVEVNGLDLEVNRKEVQQQIGYLAENCSIYPEMRVLQFLDYAADLKGIKAHEKSDRITYAVERTGLYDVTQNLVGSLSRGYRQRLGVAQTLLCSPSVFIFDEPTNGLDPSQIFEMRSLIKELAGNATILLSTHNLQEATAISNRVMIMDRGRIVLDSYLKDLQATCSLEIHTDADLPAFENSLGEMAGMKICHSSICGLQHHYIIEASALADSSEVAALVSGALAQKGFKIFAVLPVIRDLETIFAAVTSQNVISVVDPSKKPLQPRAGSEGSLSE